jgi:hypothetical protein
MRKIALVLLLAVVGCQQPTIHAAAPDAQPNMKDTLLMPDSPPPRPPVPPQPNPNLGPESFLY